MPRLLDIQQGSPQWHAWREGKITASLAPVIMGLSPYMTPLQLFNQMQGIEKKKESTSAMRRGSTLEEPVRRLINERHGFNYQPICMESSDLNWMGASLDGWDEGVSAHRALEIKCPNARDHEVAFRGDVPPHYFPQIQHMMFVSETEQCLYVSYGSDETLHEVKVQRDDLFIKKMLKAEKEFYDRLADFDPPKAIPDRDYRRISDPESIKRAKEYREVCLAMDYLEGKKELIRKDLISLAEGQSSLIDDLPILKIVSKGRVDYSKIECLKKIDLNQYRGKPTVSWRID